jgi:alpha-L-rhamnosidase
MKLRLLAILIAATACIGPILLPPNLAAAVAGSLRPTQPRCEYLVNPKGIDETRPRLTWLLEGNGSRRGERQSSYQIIVASSAASLEKNVGDLWDTGRVDSDATVNIEYRGRALTSRARCFWKVKVWDDAGHPSAWSETASWTMGLLAPSDWVAEYISFRDKSEVFKNTGSLYLPAARQYRKEFAAAKAIRRATIYATALGIYELHLNGQRVGDAFFAPGWSDYHQRAYYNTYDVTSLARQGTNALAAWVADGWYSGYLGFGLLTGMGTEKVGRYTYGKTPALMAQLEIEFEDGSKQTVVTDKSWKVTGDGPIQQADFLMGEFYDARKEMPGWTKAGFNESAQAGENKIQWEQAILAQENGRVPANFYEFHEQPKGGPKIEGKPIDLGFKRPPKLEAFPGVPVRHMQELKPLAITSPTNGVYIFNLGQNFAGVVRLKVKGPAGTKIMLRYGEMLHPDGRLMTENLRKARANDFYVLRGDPEGETYTPRFTFHGFQYVEVTGFPEKPELDAITGIVMHSDVRLTSQFECSDPMVNRLFKNVVWTQRANFLDLPTDCPQRDERFGWTGDAQIYVRTATYNADVAAFYTKWIRELMESQRASGAFPGYAPFPFEHGSEFGTAWCDAGVICPWTIWKAYGDTRIIERCWEPMVKFIEWRTSESKGFLGVNHGNTWGDWLSVKETTPIDYIDTAYFAYSTRLMAEMARAVGKGSEAAKYQDLFLKIKAAFKEKYVKPDATLAVDTQTAYAMALYMDLFPEDMRKQGAEQLAKKIRANDGTMTTGFLGTRPIVPVLALAGQNDLAMQLLQSHKFPSWGYEVDQGATTIWERWNSFTKDKGFGGEQNASMNSFAHYAFGAICEWLFSGVAGIDSEGPGYQRLFVRPMPATPGSNPDQKPIDWVKAEYDSVRGRIASAWKINNGDFDLDLTVPVNTSATVYLPASAAAGVTEGGHALSQQTDVTLLRMEGGRALLEVASGTYHFNSRNVFKKESAAR